MDELDSKIIQYKMAGKNTKARLKSGLLCIEGWESI